MSLQKKFEKYKDKRKRELVKKYGSAKTPEHSAEQKNPPEKPLFKKLFRAQGKATAASRAEKPPEPAFRPKKGPAKNPDRPVKDQDIRKLFYRKAKEVRKKATAAERKRRLAMYLEKSGLEIDQQQLARRIFHFSVILALALTAVYIYYAAARDNSSWLGIMLQVVVVVWILGFIIVWGLSWVFFRIYLDLLMFRRQLEVEEVLPDFLQLTSANLRAGMPIDRALWFAVRPRFGILAHEIEDVAKKTIAGEPLNSALLDFARKYNSQMLTRSVYLLNEGMDAGGDVADLLNKIALNIQEMRGMKKEMSANVTTYVIFISFAAMLAAPFLFALSNQLLSIVQSIASDVAAGGGAKTGGMGLTINISEETIKLEHYRIFAYTCLSFSSLFSGIIVATVRKGNVKEGLHYIPVFIIVSLIVYFISSRFLAALLGGVI